MNPANGIDTTGLSPVPITDAGPAFGNSYPMYGTVTAMYAQLGYLWPNVVGSAGVLPYVAATLSRWDRLGMLTDVYSVGASLLLDGHHSKISFDVQSRPTFGTGSLGEVVQGARQLQMVMQYQVAI